MSNYVLEAVDLSKTFVDGARSIPVLQNINLGIDKGEMLAIVGASGSGKSTLLHLLGGLDKPSEGQLFIQQQDIKTLKPTQLGQLRNRYLGFVYQFHHLLPEFTALENVAMPLLIGGMSTQEASHKAEMMLKKVGLAERLTHKPAKLSGGERQRTAIARAIVSNPACVLADEPTGNLDSKTANAVFDLMLELNQEVGCSFVIVTHDIALSQRMARTVTIVDGQLKA